ncbi:MAG: hypothetical protein M3Q71_16105 [Chloroflexota bacterium]|nr:hypothetical protein [Chloroflexota bacterium]
MQRWEYRTRVLGVAFGADWLHERLAELGEQGWELVVALPVGGSAAAEHHTYVFKRPKADSVMLVAPPWGEAEAPSTIGATTAADRAA